MSLAAAATWAGPDGKRSAALGWLESVPGRRPEPNRQACELFTGDGAAFVALGSYETLARVRDRVAAWRDFQLATTRCKVAAFREFAHGVAGAWSALAANAAGELCTVEARGGVARVTTQDDVWAIGRRCETAFESLAGSLHEHERGSPGAAVGEAINDAFLAAPREWGGSQVLLLPELVTVAADWGR